MSVNRVFSIIRALALGVTSLFTIIVIIMAALITDYSARFYYGAYYHFAALAMATGILTLFTLPLMLTLSIIRKGAFTSMIIVELIWTGLLWVLWLATGGTIVSNVWISYCSAYIYAETQVACMETQALAAFSFLNWIFLMVSNIFLFSLAIKQHARGYTNIWTNYVSETDFTAPAPVSATQMQPTEKLQSGFVPQYTGSTFIGSPQQVMTPVQSPTAAHV